MTDKKNKIILIIVIFLVFAIPLIFLSHKINKELIFTEDRLKENLRERLLDTASKLEESLEPFNYLKTE